MIGLRQSFTTLEGWTVVSLEELPFVSVVVSFHNEGAFLNQCVASLLELSYPPERFEIILVNDGSDDGSEEAVSELVRANEARIRILTQPDKGPAAGRNLGVSNAKGSIVAFTDPDCIVDKGWLKQHVANYRSEDIGGVEGKVETDWDQLMEPIRISPAGYRYVTCNISYRREVLEKVGLFDEQFRWKEDDEVAYRVIKAGWKIVTDEHAIIYHPVKKLSARGLVRFGLKHRYDVPFYGKHPDVAKGYFRMVKFGPIALTREFFVACGLILIFLLALVGLLTGNVITLLPLIPAAVWGMIHRRSMLRRKVKASILWMTIFILLIEVGRLWGTIKFRRFFL